MSSPLPALRARSRAIPTRALDIGLAALVVIGTALEATTAQAPAGERAEALLPAAVVAVALLLRRRAPIAASVLSLAALPIAVWIPDAVFEQLNLLYFGALFCLYHMAARETGRRLRVGLALVVAILVAGTIVEDARHPAGELATELLAGFAFFVVAPVLAGRVLRSRVQLGEALEEKAALTEANRAGAAEEAVNVERVRIASELHDLVAHALGAMTIQASAARRLATVDAGRAAGAFAAIETTGRDALGELRSLLAVLREDDHGAGPSPQPSLEDLPGLAARARAAGLPVALSVEGTRPDDLAAGVELTGYRVVQDALRAARDQGGADHARVRLRYGRDRLEIEVADDGRGDARRRLLGLQERVRLFGGEVSVDGRGTGEHVLRARLPTGAGG